MSQSHVAGAWELAKEAARLGFGEPERTKNGHFRFKHPDTGQTVVCSPAVTSKHCRLNNLALLKRAARAAAA